MRVMDRVAKCVEQPPKVDAIALEANIEKALRQGRHRLDSGGQPITDEDAITRHDCRGAGRFSVGV